MAKCSDNTETEIAVTSLANSPRICPSPENCPAHSSFLTTRKYLPSQDMQFLAKVRATTTAQPRQAPGSAGPSTGTKLLKRHTPAGGWSLQRSLRLAWSDTRACSGESGSAEKVTKGKTTAKKLSAADTTHIVRFYTDRSVFSGILFSLGRWIEGGREREQNKEACPREWGLRATQPRHRRQQTKGHTNLPPETVCLLRRVRTRRHAHSLANKAPDFCCFVGHIVKPDAAQRNIDTYFPPRSSSSSSDRARAQRERSHHLPATQPNRDTAASSQCIGSREGCGAAAGCNRRREERGPCVVVL